MFWFVREGLAEKAYKFEILRQQKIHNEMQEKKMTREEAVKKIECNGFSISSIQPIDICLALEALGLIKFEEEKKAPSVLIANYFNVREATAKAVIDLLNHNGYEIVKKV